jgi:hypothetical protein
MANLPMSAPKAVESLKVKAPTKSEKLNQKQQDHAQVDLFGGDQA